VAKRVREVLLPIARRHGATIQVAEVPPGPPVLQTLVAEVYGPDSDRRRQVAKHVKDVLERTPGVVDVDWYVEEPQRKVDLVVDDEKAAAAGLSAASVASVVRMATSGETAGLLNDPAAREDIPIVLRLPRGDRSDLSSLETIRLVGRRPVALGELTDVRETVESQSLYHKNLQPVTYVTGDMAGGAESPVYAILQMNKALESLELPEGYAFDIFNAQQPFDSTKYAMKWDGEWHITIEVFRDLGLAFAVVLLLIYILVVGWFESFETPFTIMAAIPFSLVGILPAHALMGAFFTATSMIGFIAGAGIVVRNSIILVDFIELRLRDGMPLQQAVIDAGAVRFRPMALTAAAVVVGSASSCSTRSSRASRFRSWQARSPPYCSLALRCRSCTTCRAADARWKPPHPCRLPPDREARTMWKCPPQSVLVPVDFSDASARALGLAGLVASAFDAGLVALHAETLEAPPYFTHDQIDALERERQVARANGLQFVVGFAAKQTAYAVQATVVERPPAEAILEATRSSDLVIMGTHGRRGPSRWWLGSVAERVVRDATIPSW